MPGVAAPAQPVLHKGSTTSSPGSSGSTSATSSSAASSSSWPAAAPRRGDIQVNLLTALRTRLRGGPCRPNGQGLLLRIDDRTGRFPDASFTCSERGPNDLTEPTALFEIPSEPSKARDRGEKRREYQRLPSLAHDALID